MYRKTKKVLSQFPAQGTLNTHLYNESPQAGWLYSLCLGRNRAGLLELVTGSDPCFSLHFYLQTSQKGSSMTQGMWQPAQSIRSPCDWLITPFPKPWPLTRPQARKDVTKAILVSRWNYQKANKHSPFSLKNKKQIWTKTNLEKETKPHANRNRKHFYTLCTSAERWWERGRVIQGLSAQKNDSCDHFVLITQNKSLLLFLKKEQIHQCLLTEKVIAIRMVATRTMARTTTRMRFWMILGESKGNRTKVTQKDGGHSDKGHPRPRC